MQIQRAYKTELKLTKSLLRLCEQHAGTARFAYNWGLERKQDAYKNKEKTPTAIDLHRELNMLKKGSLAWLYETSKCAPQEALRNFNASMNLYQLAVSSTESINARGDGIAGLALTG